MGSMITPQNQTEAKTGVSNFSSDYGTINNAGTETYLNICGKIVRFRVRFSVTNAYSAWNGSIVKINGVSIPHYQVDYFGSAQSSGALDPLSENTVGIQLGLNIAVGTELRISGMFIMQ